MKTPNDIWDDLGELSEQEMSHVLVDLFAAYENSLKNDPQGKESLAFFEKLDVSISKVRQCNSNRR